MLGYIDERCDDSPLILNKTLKPISPHPFFFSLKIGIAAFAVTYCMPGSCLEANVSWLQ